MKKFYFLALAATLGVSASAQEVKTRAAFATGISHEKVDGQTVVKFNLTGNTATGANLLLLKDNEVVNSIDLGEVQFGQNSIPVKFYDMPNGIYNYAIEVVSEIEGTAPVKVYSSPSVTNQRLGIAIVTDTESDNYGTVVAVRNGSAGVDVISTTGEIKNHLKGNAVMSKLTSHVSAYSRKGDILISSWSDAGSGIYCYDPSTPDTAPFQLFAGTRDDDGLFTYGGQSIGGSENGIGVSLDGSKIYAFSEELDNGAGTIYNVGDGALSEGCITSAPTYSETMISVASNLSAAGADASPLVRDAAYCTAATPYGLMVGQARAAQDQWPFYIFWDPATDKTRTYRDGKIFTSSASGCAFNKDYTLFAHVCYSSGGVDIHNVTWETADGMTYPVFSKPIYTLPSKTNYGQVVFDAADNVYVSTNYTGTIPATYTYAVYALPGRHTAQTPAKAADLMDVVATSGIASIETEEAPAVYYNLQGVRVDNPQNGVFIELRGNKATKVVK